MFPGVNEAEGYLTAVCMITTGMARVDSQNLLSVNGVSKPDKHGFKLKGTEGKVFYTEVDKNAGKWG